MATKKTDRASVQKAADRAAKRAAKTPKTATPVKGVNDTDEQNRALFLHHLAKFPALIKAKDVAVNSIRNAYKAAKADGFVKIDFETAFAIQGADGEKKKKAAIARDLTIAKWLGCDLGSQLDLFVQDERVPAVDRAYEEGKMTAMQGEKASPPHDPATAQHKRWMEGWHDGNEQRVKTGIAKLHPEVQKDETDKAAKKALREADQAKDAAAFDKPTSGVAMTREEYRRDQATKDGANDLKH